MTILSSLSGVSIEYRENSAAFNDFWLGGVRLLDYNLAGIGAAPASQSTTMASIPLTPLTLYRGQERGPRRRVAIIGHVIPSPVSLPAAPGQLAPMLKLFNYTRVLTDSGNLVDHVAFLKQERGITGETPFSVWEMYLCAGLLLKSHVERNGHEALLINYIDSDNQDAVGRRLQDFQPDVVVVSTTFVLTPKHLSEAGQLLRRYLPNTFMVAGGHHVFTTLMYMDEAQKRQYLLNSKLDALVDDVQGETTLLELLRQWPSRLPQVPNLLWKNEAGDTFINNRVQENNDVNSTLLDFNDLPEGSIIHAHRQSCSFKCAFCSYPTIAGPLATMDLDHAVNTMRRRRTPAWARCSLWTTHSTCRGPASRSSST